jgi:hypothetical protein
MNSITLHKNPVNGQACIFAVLALVMAATRFHHEGTAFALPDASLAVFFLAGVSLGGSRVFFMLLTLAVAIDYLAITVFGVGDYCISPAYAFLVPTYAVMWFGGLWFQRFSHQSWMPYTLMLAVILAFSVSLAFLVSNGSFYWFSGKVSEAGILDYALGLTGEYPAYVGATAFYILLGLGADALLCHRASVPAGESR